MRAETAEGLDLWKLENLKIFNGYEIKTERKLSFEAPSSPEDNNNGDVDDSDGQQGAKSKGQTSPTTPRNKCGRPANPIPRHKRHSHIKAEFKRRDKIQKCFDSLITMVPALSESSSSKESKSAMLFKTAEYGRRLKAEHMSKQSEKAALLQEIESLGTEIHDLQLKLPQHGAKTTIDVEHTAHMDTLYDEYVQSETKKNWKFWLFGFFVQPLYLSYRTVMSGTMTQHEFTQKSHEWIQDTMSLTSLRKGFLSGLRKVSTQTDIMTAPGQLEQEARRKAGVHCIQQTHQEIPSPRAPRAPSSLAATPVVSPAPTPPRTPTMRKHSIAEREEPKCKSRAGSRSRSNTPPSGDTRQRKRSNKRSEKRTPASDMTTVQPTKMRLSMPNNTHGVTNQLATIGGNTVTCPIVSVQYVPANLVTSISGSSSNAAVTLAALLSGPLKQEGAKIPVPLSATSPIMYQSVPSSTPMSNASPIMYQSVPSTTPMSNASPTIFHSVPSNVPLSSVSPIFHSVPSSSVPLSTTSPILHSVPSSFQHLPPVCVDSCLPTPHSAISTMDESVITTFIESLLSDTPSNASVMSQPMVTCTDTSSVSLCSDVVMTCVNGDMPMSEHTSVTVTSPTFVPVDQRSIITNSTLIPHNFLAPSSTFHAPDLGSVFSYDVMETSVHGGGADTGSFNPFSSASSTLISDYSTVNSVHGTFNNHCPQSDMKDLEVKSHPLNTDEDSLMKMLTFDVMDVNSVMNFLDSDQDIHPKAGFGASNIS